MPDGQRLRTQVLGLRYFDSASGQVVLLAEVKDCKGEIVGSNQVVYADCFASTTERPIKASVRYTYKKAGVSQDIIVQDLPAPGSFNLDSASTRLQVLSEFLNPPSMDVKERAQTGQLSNCDLVFHSMRIGRGRAFNLGDEKPRDRILVRKELLRQDARTVGGRRASANGFGETF